MTNEPSADRRRFSEDEVGRILKRATELQIAEPSAAGSSGLSLGELEEIALEAGIDPRHLRRAAQEVQAGRSGGATWSRLTGAPLEVALEASLPGELTAAGLERLVPVIQAHADEHGQASLLGRTLTWRAETSTKTRSALVVVSARNGETHLRVEERLHGLAGQLFGGLMGGVGVGAGIGVGAGVGAALGSALFATVFPVGMIGLGYVAAREIYGFNIAARRRALGAMLDRLVAEASDCLAEEKGTDSVGTDPEDRPALPRG